MRNINDNAVQGRLSEKLLHELELYRAHTPRAL